MQPPAIDHLVLVVPNLEAAAEPFERLGLSLTPRMEHAGAGTANRAIFVGSERGHFYLELLTIHDRNLAAEGAAAPYLPAFDAGGGVSRLIFATTGMGTLVGSLTDAGFAVHTRDVHRDDGSTIATVCDIEADAPAPSSVGLIQYIIEEGERYASRSGRGLFDHAFPLERLDHLALIPGDPAMAERFFTAHLGLPLAGQVETPAMTIRQLQAGDAILELLVPSGPESPIAARPKGLVPMFACEVPSLDQAVETARQRGFAPSDPADGVLPGTRTATIPPGELSGIGLQLLEYV
ncbi:MAG: VOC family protein [Dehalococcoidia bacterium]|nr:VOC family protein [Dehalococcoidia bacterium]